MIPTVVCHTFPESLSPCAGSATACALHPWFNSLFPAALWVGVYYGPVKASLSGHLLLLNVQGSNAMKIPVTAASCM